MFCGGNVARADQGRRLISVIGNVVAVVILVAIIGLMAVAVADDVLAALTPVVIVVSIVVGGVVVAIVAIVSSGESIEDGRGVKVGVEKGVGVEVETVREKRLNRRIEPRHHSRL